MLSCGEPIRIAAFKYTKRELLSAIGAYFSHQQMLCLQNFENLSIIVSKALGGGEPDKSSTSTEAKEVSREEIASILGVINGGF